MAAAFRLGEQISYKDTNGDTQTGIVERSVVWPPTFAYSLEGNSQQWIAEESIEGFEHRRRASCLKQ